MRPESQTSRVPYTLALLALACAAVLATSGCGAQYAVEFSEDGESWVSSLTTESKPVAPDNEYMLYVRVRHLHGLRSLVWFRFQTSDVDPEWQPAYYRTVPPVTDPGNAVEIEEGEALWWSPWGPSTMYLAMKVTEPDIPTSHLLPTFSVSGKGWLPWTPWHNLGSVSPQILVTGNFMFKPGEAGVGTDWQAADVVHEDIVLKTTDVGQADQEHAGDDTLKTQAQTYTIRVVNLDNAASGFVLRMENSTFSGLARYYVGSQEITDEVEGAGYNVPTLAPGEDFLVRMEVLPVGRTADYETITLLSALTGVAEPFEWAGPFQRFDAMSIGFRIVPEKTATTAWRETPAADAVGPD